MNSTQLEHRLNRIQGQIEAIKKNLQGSGKCTEMMWQFKAVQNGIKKAAEEYISLYAEECMQNGKKGISKKQIQTIVSAAFNL